MKSWKSEPEFRNKKVEKPERPTTDIEETFSWSFPESSGEV
jgi:hypothetical protein